MINVYANNIMGLLRFMRKEQERIVKLAFATRFPEDILVELQKLLSMEYMEVSDLITAARVVRINRTVI